MADTEEYFPRGGKKPTTLFKQSVNVSNLEKYMKFDGINCLSNTLLIRGYQFLGAPEKGDKKKKKLKNKSDGDDGYLSDEVTIKEDQSSINCTVGLSYQVSSIFNWYTPSPFLPLKSKIPAISYIRILGNQGSNQR